MFESFLISFASLLSGCVVTSIAIGGKYELIFKSQRDQIDCHHQTLIDLNKVFEQEKCEIKLQSQESLEQHLLANQELRMLKSKAEQTIDRLAKEVADNGTKLIRSESAFRELSSEYETLDDVYSTLQANFDEQLGKQDKLESNIEDLNFEIGDLASKLEDAITECEQVKSNYVAMATQANEEIAKLQTMLKSYHEALDETAKKNQQLLNLTNVGIPNKQMNMAN